MTAQDAKLQTILISAIGGNPALAAGVAFYFIRAERTPAPVVPPKPVVPEAAAPQGVKPTPPAPESPGLGLRPDASAPIALAEGRPRFLRSTSRVRSRDRCAIAGSWTTRPRVTGRQGEGPTWSYTLDLDAAGERLKEIKVVASDGDAVKAEIRWRLKVLDTNRRPCLVVAMPTTQTLTVKLGETLGPGRGPRSR